MKFLLSIYIGFILSLTAAATPLDDIKVKINSKESKLEITVISKSKKPYKASFTVIDAEGKTVRILSASLKKGKNIIAVSNITELEEGTYKVKMESEKINRTTTFVVWK